MHIWRALMRAVYFCGFWNASDIFHLEDEALFNNLLLQLGSLADVRLEGLCFDLFNSLHANLTSVLTLSQRLHLLASVLFL